jgi:hypothetical protein
MGGEFTTVSKNDAWGEQGSTKVSRDIFRTKFFLKNSSNSYVFFENKKSLTGEGYETIAPNVS